jgi:hypothetical protein
MVGSQFHPEFLSRPNLPHPLFMALIRAAVEHARARMQDDANLTANGFIQQDLPDETQLRN